MHNYLRINGCAIQSNVLLHGTAVTGASATAGGGGIPEVICFLIIDGVCMGSENSFSSHAPQEQDKGRCASTQVIVITPLLK